LDRLVNAGRGDQGSVQDHRQTSADVCSSHFGKGPGSFRRKLKSNFGPAEIVSEESGALDFVIGEALDGFLFYYVLPVSDGGLRIAGAVFEHLPTRRRRPSVFDQILALAVNKPEFKNPAVGDLTSHSRFERFR